MYICINIDAKKDLTTCNIMKALKKRHISDVRVFLMIHLEIPFHKVQEFTCSQHSNHDWILIQGLEYWLRNYKEPSWETLATALEAAGDSRTAGEIRRTYTGIMIIIIIKIYVEYLYNNIVLEEGRDSKTAANISQTGIYNIIIMLTI